MKLLSHIPYWLKNKYFITTIAFIVWMLFFDDRDVYNTYFKQQHELNNLQISKHYYEAQINITRQELNELKMSATTIEKYAREKYYMKRDNEDLFILKEKNK